MKRFGVIVWNVSAAIGCGLCALDIWTSNASLIPRIWAWTAFLLYITEKMERWLEA